MTLPLLFAPMTLGGLEIRNRLWVSPMCQYAVLGEDGVPTDWHLAHLGSLAAGGTGLVIAEATAVSPEGRISPRDTGLWNDAQQEAWERIVRLIHASGSRAGIQLGHAGRKASTFPDWGAESQGSVPESEGGWRTVAPSPIAFDGLDDPTALDAEGIDGVVRAFAAAAARARAAGFDVVEIHAAHGYLLHQFLSPLSNHREDRWGGSLENRARIVVDVVEAVAEVFPGPLFVRVSATDWVESGGWDVEQTAKIVPWLTAAGADLIDVSSGGNLPAPIPVAPGYQTGFSDEIRRRTGASTASVGLITTAQQAESILVTGQADAILLGREHLRDPHTASRFARELGVDPATIRTWVAPPHRRGHR